MRLYWAVLLGLGLASGIAVAQNIPSPGLAVYPAPSSGAAPSGSAGDIQTYATSTTFGHLTPGTGVATALAIAVGSAGGPVTNGGALGTPSSGVATNLTGTAAGLTAGNVTTNANLTGPITSVGNTTSIASSIALPGAPTTTTAAVSDNTTKVATTAFTTTAINNAVAGINPAVAVQAATTSAANTSGLTYSNGISGVGATFTGTANTAIVIDGYTFTALGQRLLVKNDTQSPSGAFNGVYYVTQVQTSLLPPILTRALDYDQPSDINNTGAIPVINGTVNGTTSWVISSSVNTVGTDPLTYVQFTQNPASVAITGGTISGLTALSMTSGQLANTSVGATPLVAGTGATLVAPREYYVCTGTCTVTPPTPATGDEFCVYNDDNVATVITLAAIIGVQYEVTARTSYKAANTSIVSGGAVGDKMCIVGRDSTHYQVLSFTGTWG